MASSPLLSLLVVSYNQPDKLRRCLSSIVSLDLPFEFEVIVSDDHSTDSTFAVAIEFASRYPFIHPVHNQYGQGIGWNRCNAYNSASGKYFANIDGDDYILYGSSHYRHQVEKLETHSECSCCMSRLYVIDDGDDVSPGRTMTKMKDNLFSNGDYIKPCDYIENLQFVEHMSFVFRRNPSFRPEETYGKRFDDIYIQYYFMIGGDIIFLNEAGYVYVQYPDSDSHRKNDDSDKYIIGCFAISLPYYYPQWTDSFTKRYLPDFKKLLKMVVFGYKMSYETYDDVKCFNAWIFNVLYRGATPMERLSCCFRWTYLKLIQNLNLYTPFALKIARKTCL